MNALNKRNDNPLFVEDYVSNRAQDVFLHNPPSGDATIPRNARRRANAVVRQPHYYSKNREKDDQSSKRPDSHYLPLHRWNAKRMKMQLLWGWYLPMKHNQRSPTSFLKQLSDITVVHDSSYFECILIQGSVEDILSIIGRITANAVSVSPACLSGNEMQTIPVYLPSDSQNVFLGYVDVLIQDSTALFSCHPVIFESFRDSVSKLLPSSLSLSQSSCCRFSIRGYRSDEIIPLLFPSFSSSSDHHVHYLSYKQPQSIGNYYAPEYTVQQGLGKQQQPLPTQRYFFKSQPESLNRKKDIQPSLRTLFEDSSSCCLVQLQGAHPPVVSGWELFVSLDSGHPCWNALMNSRCVPLAQIEWHAFHTFAGKPLFPYDYPDTPAGMGYCLTIYDSPYVQPDTPVDVSLTKNSLINLFLEMEWSLPLLPVARTKKDFVQALPPFAKGREPSQRCLVNVNVKVLGKGSISLPCSIRCPSEQNLLSPKETQFIPRDSNDTIGFLTSSLFSSKASAWVGIGFCDSKQLWNEMKSQKSRSDCVVLLADEHSPNACFARLTVCVVD